MRLMSIRLAGRASRKFMTGTRLCPPARIFPSSPCVARRSSASSTVRGAKYLNETGFISDEHAKRPSQQIKRHERSDRERVERQHESNAAAKIRVGEAVGKVAEIAHQVHGAIDSTHEHSLHRPTRRLW